MLNVAVTEVGMQGAGGVTFVGQGITAGVPKHARVRLEGQHLVCPLKSGPP